MSSKSNKNVSKTVIKDKEVVIKKTSKLKKDEEMDEPKKEDIKNDKEIQDNSEKKTKKDITFAKEQEEIFEKIKLEIGITDKVNYFTSFDLNNISEKLVKQFEPITKFYHSKVWINVKLDNPEYCINVLKRIFKHHGYDIVSKRITGPDQKKGLKHFVIKVE